MKQYHGFVQSIERLTPTILRLRLMRKDQRPFFDFLPGQYAALSFPGQPDLKPFRSFSIASSPSTPEYLEFGIRMLGRFTSALIHLRPGDEATVQGPFGSFTTQGVQTRPITMLAGGIGVTPFMSMVRAAADFQLPNDLTLLFSNRSAEETPYLDELMALEKKNPKLRVVFAGTDGNGYGRNAHTATGRITGEVIAQAVGDQVWGSAFFVCGPPAFMGAMRQTLRVMGVPERLIRSENFSVKPGVLFEPKSVWPKVVFAGWGAAATVFVSIIFAQSHPAAVVSAPFEQVIPTTTTTVSSPTNVASVPVQTSPTVNTNMGTPTAPTTKTSPTKKTVVQQPTYTPPTYTPPQPVYVPPRATMS